MLFPTYCFAILNLKSFRIFAQKFNLLSRLVLPCDTFSLTFTPIDFTFPFVFVDKKNVFKNIVTVVLLINESSTNTQE